MEGLAEAGGLGPLEEDDLDNEKYRVFQSCLEVLYEKMANIHGVRFMWIIPRLCLVLRPCPAAITCSMES